MTDDSVLQEDLREMLQALGMPDYARSQSPHDVFQDALAEMKRQLRITSDRSAALKTADLTQPVSPPEFDPIQAAIDADNGGRP
jgi:hypothetical protein